MHHIRGVVGWLFPIQNEGMTGVSLFNAQFSRMTFGLLHDSGYDVLCVTVQNWSFELRTGPWMGFGVNNVLDNQGSQVMCKLLISILSMFCDVIAA